MKVNYATLNLSASMLIEIMSYSIKLFRNPGDLETEPFCYVEHNRKEICGISKCGKLE